ncbi:MAG: protein kinase [Actinomycetota bacterium]
MQTRRPVTVLAGRYALEQELGRSGTGMAWRAEDRLLGRTVTVKVIHPSLGDDPAFAQRFAEEARKVASLSAPGIARLLDSGEQDGVPFVVREHIDGASARTRLDREGPLPADEAARIAGAVLEALLPAHAAGILHLNLGLEDVLLTPEGHVRVTDLGIGSAVTASRPADAVRLLGRRNLPPEQAASEPVDERTDVFAVGAMLYELLTGQTPEGRRSPRDLRPGVPRSLDRIVGRALAADPAERFPNVHAFASALATSAAEHDEANEDRRGWLPRWVGTWLSVPLAIALVAASAIALGLSLGRLEVGGPLGIRAADDPSPSARPEPSGPVTPASAFTFDPFGDDSENDSNVALAIDGDRSTAWRSENYFDGSLHKDGVGVVFDLGERRDVSGFLLKTPNPGFLFHVAVGDDPDRLVEAIGDANTAQEETRGALTGAGRYVLVWITTVVETDDGNRAEIAEFRVVVDAA